MKPISSPYSLSLWRTISTSLDGIEVRDTYMLSDSPRFCVTCIAHFNRGHTQGHFYFELFGRGCSLKYVTLSATGPRFPSLGSKTVPSSSGGIYTICTR